jgi:hypothetical protein
MKHVMKIGLVTLIIGLLLFVYGLWALYSGEVLSTWARIEYRPSLIYWVTVIALTVTGGLNVAFGIRSLLR